MNGGQGYDDSKDALYGMGDKDQQQKQSEILSYFMEYNKSFEKHSSNLQKIQHFLAYQNQSSILNQLQSKNPLRKDQLFDICETFVEDENYNAVEILSFFKKKRKVSDHASSESRTIDNEIKIEEEGKVSLGQNKEVDELNSNVFENVTLSFNFNLGSNREGEDQEEEGKVNKENKNNQGGVFKSSSKTINVFSQFDEEEEEDSINDQIEERKYQEFISKINQNRNNMRVCNSGSEISQKDANDYYLINNTRAEFDTFQMKQVSEKLNNQIINKKFQFDLSYLKKEKLRVVEIDKIVCKNVFLFQRKQPIDEFAINLIQKASKSLVEPKTVKLFTNLDDIRGNCFQTLINLQISIELTIESESKLKQEMELENSQNKTEKSLQFHIQNFLSNTSHAYFTEFSSINKQIQLNCKENADLYSLLCQEDVEQVLSSFQTQKQIQRFLYYDGFYGQEHLNNEAACFIKQRYKQPVNDKCQLDISLWLPTDNLKDLEIIINNQDIFSPINYLKKIKYQQQNLPLLQQQQYQQQQQILLQKQYQIQQQLKKNNQNQTQ